MVCRSCQRDNPPGFKHCLHCGEMIHLQGRVNNPSTEAREKSGRIHARVKRRKAIERIAEENPEMAAKVLRTWLNSE